MACVGGGDNFVTYHKIMSLMERSNVAPPRRRVKWTRPVSRKFYESLCSLIRSASEFSDDVDVDFFIHHCIDVYIDHGKVIADLSDTETVMFTLLQPQIDKALERSRRARAAALRRREAKEQSGAEESAMAVGTSNPMSRELKRAERREAAMARRLQKHQKRLARRASRQSDNVKSHVSECDG